MKKIIFIVLMIIFFSPNVYASEFNMNSNTSATLGGTKNRYRATEIYNTGLNGTYTFGTRYSGRISNIETYFDYPFVENTTYRLTYNMATEDFRNNFEGAYWWDCDDESQVNPYRSNVSYISYKKIQVSFKPLENTTCIHMWVKSTSVSNTAITGVSNWNLSSITIYDPDWQTGGSGQGTATPSPSTPDPNQQIIDNANQNTSDVIENNNSNTDKIIDNQKELLGNCRQSKNLWPFGKSYSGGSEGQWALSDTSVSFASGTYTLSADITGGEAYVIFNYKYSDNIDHITSLSNFVTLNFTNEVVKIALYVPSNVTVNNIMLEKGSSHSSYEEYGQEVCVSKIDETNQAINGLNDNITNDNIDSGTGSDFFSGFTNNMHGLSSIITLPLSTIQSLTNSQCTPLTLPIPFTNKNITLPCMTEIYQQHVPLLLTLLRTCWLGIISYKALIDIFAMVKGFKDPDSDKIEVMEL